MNYYPFHIGDYKSHTSHLTYIEDLAYRRMLDWYYLHERPLPKDAEHIARLIGMREHAEDIKLVLGEFFAFDKSSQKWRNKRADENIEFKNNKRKKSIESAKSRWDKEKYPCERNANAMRTQCQPIANSQYPIANSQIDNVGAGAPTSKTAQKRLLPVPFKSIIEKWNEHAESNGLPLVAKQTSTLEGQLRQRWKDDMPSMSQWENFFDYVMESRFLSGNTTPANGRTRPFRATLAWITKESNFAKIAAGEYH